MLFVAEILLIYNLFEYVATYRRIPIKSNSLHLGVMLNGVGFGFFFTITLTVWGLILSILVPIMSFILLYTYFKKLTEKGKIPFYQYLEFDIYGKPTIEIPEDFVRILKFDESYKLTVESIEATYPRIFSVVVSKSKRTESNQKYARFEAQKNKYYVILPNYIKDFLKMKTKDMIKLELNKNTESLIISKLAPITLKTIVKNSLGIVFKLAENKIDS